MPVNTKKISIRRELHEIVIVRRPKPKRMYCTGCGSCEDFLTLDEAVGILGIGTRDIIRGIEAGEIHAADTPNGQVLVCARYSSESAL